MKKEKMQIKEKLEKEKGRKLQRSHITKNAWKKRQIENEQWVDIVINSAEIDSRQMIFYVQPAVFYGLLFPSVLREAAKK